MNFRTGISYVQDLVKSARKYYKKKRGRPAGTDPGQRNWYQRHPGGNTEKTGHHPVPGSELKNPGYYPDAFRRGNF